MDVVFTICSNNYLAHAATLMQSWFAFHPHTQGYVILVDELSEAVDYNLIKPASILPIANLAIPTFNTLVEQYNITELNTAVKPDVFLHLFTRHPNSKIVYLDPDILVTSKFDEVFESLNTNDFVLTPHICHPIDDESAPTDYHTLRTGIFNLGFIALKNSEQIHRYLLWWRDRVFKYGYCNLPENMFYDQLWANYIPVLFDKYYILKHPGYNMANWNLHERYLSKTNENKWIVNDEIELKFFHFSGYKFSNSNSIGSYHSRYDFNSRPDLYSVFHSYQNKLVENNVESISKIPCVYFEQHKKIKIMQEQEQEAMRFKEIAPVSFKIKVLRKIAAFARRLAYN